MFDPSDPTGPPKMIDPSQVDAAQQMGGELAFKMIDPQDKQAKWIRHSQLQAAADAGGTPANMHEATRIQKALAPVNASDSIGTGTLPIRQKLAIGPMGSVADASIGALRGAARTYKGLGDMGRKVAHAAASAVGLTPKDQGEYSDPITRFADEKDATPGEKAGDVLETIAEYLWGEGEAKAGMEATGAGAVKLGDRYKAVSEGLKAVEKLPTALQEGIASMIRNGTVSGAQSLVKSGGDVDQAAEGAALGAGTAGLLEGVGGALKAGVRRIAAARSAADAAKASSDQYEQAIAAWKAQKDAATQGHADALAEWQKRGEAATQAHADAVEAWKAQKDAATQGHADALAEWQKRGEAATQAHADAVEAWKAQKDAATQGHADALAEWQKQVDEFNQKQAMFESERKAGNQSAARAAITDAARGAAQDSQTRFSAAGAATPATAKSALDTVGDFEDAAEALREGIAKPIYDRFNQATEGLFGRLRAARSAALKNMAAPGAPEKLAQANSDLDTLFAQTEGKVSSADFKAVTSTWRDSKILDQFHAALEPAYGTSKELAARQGAERTFNGDMASRNLKKVITSVGRPEAERVIGKARLATLEDMIDMNRSPANRAKFGEVVQNIADEIVRQEPPPRPQPPALPVRPKAPVAEPRPQPPALPVRPKAPVAEPRPQPPSLPVKPKAPVAEARPQPPALPVRPKAPETPNKPQPIPAWMRSRMNGRLAVMAAGGAAAEAMGGHFMYGIAGGEAAYEASKYVMRKLYANAALAKHVMFIVKSGARPEFYAPFIAGLIQKQQKGQQQ